MFGSYGRVRGNLYAHAVRPSYGRARRNVAKFNCCPAVAATVAVWYSGDNGFCECLNDRKVPPVVRHTLIHPANRKYASRGLFIDKSRKSDKFSCCPGRYFPATSSTSGTFRARVRTEIGRPTRGKRGTRISLANLFDSEQRKKYPSVLQ